MRLLGESILTAATSPSPAISAHPVGWHSPVPYLFGGLAAMLGLIAFALLILACSYWKLSAYPSAADPTAVDSADPEKKPAPKAAASGWDNNVLVIMAGQVIPTFLATPSTSRTSSFASDAASTTATNSDDDKAQKVADQVSESVSGVEADQHQHHHSAV